MTFLNRLALVVSLVALCRTAFADDKIKAQIGAPSPDAIALFERHACQHPKADAAQKEACRIMRRFRSATPLSPWPTDKEVAYLGRLYEVRLNHGELTSDPVKAKYFFLQVRPRQPGASAAVFDDRSRANVSKWDAAWRGLVATKAGEEDEFRETISAIAAGKSPTNETTKFVKSAKTREWYPVLLGENGAVEFPNSGVGRAALRGIPGGLVAVALDHGDYDNGYISYIELWRVP